MTRPRPTSPIPPATRARLFDLGKQIASEQDRALDAQSPPRTPESLLRLPNRPRPRARAALVALLAASLLFALLATLWPRADDQASVFYAEAFGLPGGVGRWIANRDGETRVRFSDGSTMDLSAASRAEAIRIAEAGVQVRLERGRITASVVHAEGRTWQLFAGPFTVRVTGTQFYVDWQPELEAIEVRVTEGSVVVSGGSLDGDHRLGASDPPLTLAAPRDEAPTPPLASVALDAPPTASSAAPAPPARTPSHIEAPTPRSTAAVVAEAPAAADPAPASVIPPEASPAVATANDGGAAAPDAGGAHDAEASALMTRGDAARLAGDATRAMSAFSQVRERFAGSPQAAEAAFYLGLVAMQQHLSSQADAWFQRYLLEAPHGDFAEMARGRLIEVRERAGDTAGAREAARAYLKEHAGGLRADAARRVLSGAP